MSIDNLRDIDSKICHVLLDYVEVMGNTVRLKVTFQDGPLEGQTFIIEMEGEG